MYHLAIMSLLLLLAACGDANEPGPGGVSAEDAKVLDQAAEKLDTETANPEK